MIYPIGTLEEIEEDFGRAKMIKINLWHIRLYTRFYYQLLRFCLQSYHS